MRMVDVDSVKLIQELRLRKWAREHYVPAESRGKHWHPIVLQEMDFRDAELAAESVVQDRIGATIVPLEPTETYFIDAPHVTIPQPKSLQIPSELERIETFHG